MSATGHPVLEFRDVTRTYPGPPEVTALRECSMTISSGDFVTICGPSGSGKSTWMGLAGLLDRPTTGSVLVNGVDVTGLAEASRAALRGQWLGLVFQSFHLMPHRTVVQNIALAGMYAGVPSQQRRERADQIAHRVGLGHRAHALARTLSGGEMQRTAIARALMGDPLLVLCDEPTGNLDSGNSAAVMSLLHELNDDGTTIVVITHDPEIAASGSCRLRVRDGRMGQDA